MRQNKPEAGKADALKAQRKVEAASALREHNDARAAELAKTTRLRALRLAKEAADAKAAEEAAVVKAAAAKVAASEKAKTKRATAKAAKTAA